MIVVAGGGYQSEPKPHKMNAKRKRHEPEFRDPPQFIAFNAPKTFASSATFGSSESARMMSATRVALLRGFYVRSAPIHRFLDFSLLTHCLPSPEEVRRLHSSSASPSVAGFVPS